VELPSTMTKRGMYQRFCYDRGYKIKTDAFSAYPKLEDYPIRTDFDDVFWPLGSEPLQVCSWPSFLAYWKANYPNMIIRKPCEDVCGECTIYRNRWKYGARAKEDSEEEQDEAKEDNVQEENEEDDDELTTPAMLEQEKLIADATLHVEQAMAIREMAREAIELAQSTAHLPHLERHYCFTIDYAQTLMIPNLGDTQPGDTYYFSPKNAYIFGIVDNSIKPTTKQAGKAWTMLLL
jgi:hypothetical protein